LCYAFAYHGFDSLHTTHRFGLDQHPAQADPWHVHAAAAGCGVVGAVVSGWHSVMAGAARRETLVTTIAVLVALWIIYMVGAVASNVLGAKIISWLNALLNRVPLVKQVYGAVQKLVQSLTRKPDGVQRVVLLPFPSPDMRAIGFVTKTFTDVASGQELAAVYMPTAVNPTCGYLEIVPIDTCITTSLTADEAMNMILSGGATAPDTASFGRPIP
jgi:uncharacterized membrane protein